MPETEVWSILAPRAGSSWPCSCPQPQSRAAIATRAAGLRRRLVIKALARSGGGGALRLTRPPAPCIGPDSLHAHGDALDAAVGVDNGQLDEARPARLPHDLARARVGGDGRAVDEPGERQHAAVGFEQHRGILLGLDLGAVGRERDEDAWLEERAFGHLQVVA